MVGCSEKAEGLRNFHRLNSSHGRAMGERPTAFMRWAKRAFHARPRGRLHDRGWGVGLWFSEQHKGRKNSVTDSSDHGVQSNGGI